MGRDRRNEKRTEQFTRWIRNEKELPAWKALTFPAREAYNHLRIRCMAETAQKNKNVRNNNGEIFRSPRDLANDMGCTPKTAMAALADLQAKGWIVCTKLGSKGLSGNAKTSTYRLSMLPMADALATKEPLRWVEGSDYPVIAHASSKPKPKSGRINNLEKSKTLRPIRSHACDPFGHGEGQEQEVTDTDSVTDEAVLEPFTDTHSVTYLLSHPHGMEEPPLINGNYLEELKAGSFPCTLLEKRNALIISINQSTLCS